MAENIYDKFDEEDDSGGSNIYDQFDSEDVDIQDTSTSGSVPKWGQKNPNLYGAMGAAFETAKPIAEGVAVGAGGIYGAAGGNPLGGAGLAYGGVKALEQVANEQLNPDETLSIPQKYRNLLNDVTLGMAMEAGGQVAGKVIFEPAIKSGKWVFNTAKSYVTGKPNATAWNQAAKVWKATTSSGEIYAKNKAEAEALEQQIPGLKFTEGQKTYDPKIVQGERAAFRSNETDAGKRSVEQIANNDAALKAYYQKNFNTKGTIDDFYNAFNQKQTQLNETLTKVKAAAGDIEKELQGGDIQQIHSKIVTKIKANKQLARDEAQNLYKLLPDNVELQTTDLLKQFDEIKTPMSKVENADNFPTVLNKAIRSYSPKEMPANLKQVVDAYAKNGKELPSILKEEAAKYTKPGSETLAEIKGLRTEILNELRAEEGKITGKNSTKIMRLKKMQDAVDGTLEQLNDPKKYDKNVVDIYNTASTKWRDYKNTYENDTIGEILQQGSRGEEFRLTPEQAVGKLFNKNDVTAIDQFSKAVGKGDATKLIKEYADYDLLKKATDPVTKEVDFVKLNRWQRNNETILNKYGLGNSYNNLLKAKEAVAGAEFKLANFEKSQASKMLGADVDKAISTAFKGTNSTAKTAQELLEIAGDNQAAKEGIRSEFTKYLVDQTKTTKELISGDLTTSNAAFQKLYDKYEPALKEFYKDEPQKLKALQDIKKAYQIMVRNQVSPYGGGSDTMENLAGALSKTLGHMPVGGPMSIRATRGLLSVALRWQNSQIKSVLERAIFDPDVVIMLEDIASGKIAPEKTAEIFGNYIGKATTYSASLMGANSAEKQQATSQPIVEKPAKSTRKPLSEY